MKGGQSSLSIQLSTTGPEGSGIQKSGGGSEGFGSCWRRLWPTIFEYKESRGFGDMVEKKIDVKTNNITRDKCVYIRTVGVNMKRLNK